MGRPMNTHDIDIERQAFESWRRSRLETTGVWTPFDIWQAAIEAGRKRQYRPVYEEGWKDALEWASKRKGEPVLWVNLTTLEWAIKGDEAVIGVSAKRAPTYNTPLYTDYSGGGDGS